MIASLAYYACLMLTDAQAWLNHGIALGTNGRMVEAIQSFHEAIRLDASCADAHYSLGVAHAEQGQLAVAIDCWRQTILVDPGHANAHLNLGMVLLLCGRFTEGFREIEWRWAREDIVKQNTGYLRTRTLAALRWRYCHAYRSPIHFTQ